MRKISFLMVVIVTLFVIGCSGNVSDNKPTETSLSAIPSNLTIPIGVSGRFPNGSPSEGMGALGLFSLNIDKGSSSAELTSIRQSTLTDVLEVVDITNFLTLAPCVDCAKIKSISLNADGNAVVTIGIKHPFPVGDPFKPITGRNRADLHVFNVEGIVVANGTAQNFDGLGEKVANFNLLNADGYTGYLDQSLETIFTTDATIHPYILHFDDYSVGNFNALNQFGFESVTDPPPSGNLVMPMGSDYDYQDYVFKLVDDAPINFILAIGCTYAVSSASKNDRFSPEYRVPQHNKKAASEVRVNIITNDLKSEDTSSQATLGINILDINHAVAIGSGLDQMLSDSSVGQISVEVVGVTSTPLIINAPSVISGNGRDPMNPLHFEVTITNSAGSLAGTYMGLVKVLDTYAPGQNTSPLLGGKDGINRVEPIANPLTGVFDINEFATYSTFTIDVSEGTLTEPPVAIISSPCEDNFIRLGTSLFFDGRLSTDDVPPIVGYAWDFNWDGVPANFNVESTEDHLLYKFIDSAGYFTVGLRVEDSEGQFGYDSVLVQVVIPFVPPTWQAERPVSELTEGAEVTERNYDPSHQVVVDCEGIVHYIVKYRRNIATGPQSGLYYVNYDGSSMSALEPIDVGTDGLTQPNLRIDNHDVLHLVYNLYGNIKYCKREGGAWSTPEIILRSSDTPGYSLEYVTMDINYLGEIMVVSTKIDSNYVWYLCEVHNDGSGWTPVQDICEIYLRASSSSYQIPNNDINADIEGRFHLLFKSWPNSSAVYDYDLFHVIYENGTWSTPFKFNDDSGQNIALAGYIAPDGDLFAVWQTSRFGTFNAMYQRYDGATQTWGSSIRVSRNPDSGSYSFIPDIAVDALGHVMYVWEYYDGANRHVYYKEFQETDDSTTIFNATEREFVTGTWNRTNPNLFYDRNSGNIHCIFEDNRSNPTSYWGTDLYYSVWK